MKDRIVFFVLGAILATIAYFVGDMNNLSAQGDVTRIEKLSVGEITVDKTLVVGNNEDYSKIEGKSISVYNRKSGDMTAIYHNSVWADKIHANVIDHDPKKAVSFDNLRVTGTLYVDDVIRTNDIFVEEKVFVGNPEKGTVTIGSDKTEALITLSSKYDGTLNSPNTVLSSSIERGSYMTISNGGEKASVFIAAFADENMSLINLTDDSGKNTIRVSE